MSCFTHWQLSYEQFQYLSEASFVDLHPAHHSSFPPKVEVATDVGGVANQYHSHMFSWQSVMNWA